MMKGCRLLFVVALCVANLPRTFAQAQPEPGTVKIWVSQTTVTVGRPFWVFIEAVGSQVSMPSALEVEGLSFDPTNNQRTSSFSMGRGVTTSLEKRGFYAMAARTGPIVIPPISVMVNGVMLKTEPVSLHAIEHPALSTVVVLRSGKEVRLQKDDLVYIHMDTDKSEVYQGEAVLLRKQLWRIIYQRVNSGPYRGALIKAPTTEGFYALELETATYTVDKDPWQYDVLEEQKLLYPTRSGELVIGVWHWEGIALLDRKNIVKRDKLHYRLDAGPIILHVKPLPPEPEGFSGAVGEFNVKASISATTVHQGVPVTLAVHVTGVGNPDAIGPARIAHLDWAHVAEPDRSSEVFISPETKVRTVTKSFFYAITPLRSGEVTLPPVEFVYFSPRDHVYKISKAGPFALSVLPSSEDPQPLVVAQGINLHEGHIDILREDIRPIVARQGPLQRRHSSPVSAAALTTLPVAAYAFLALYGVRKRRPWHAGPERRVQYAQQQTLQSIQRATDLEDPLDLLHGSLIAFVAETLVLPSGGLTAEKVGQMLAERGVGEALREQLLNNLRACERARYGSARLSEAEIAELAEGVRVSVLALGAEFDGRKGRA